MAYINQVFLLGHLVDAPELKKTPAGDSVATFTMAVNSKTVQGESRADFFDCECWKGWAEILAQTASKGSLVLVTGRLKQEQWVDSKTNGKRSRIKVIAQRAFALEFPRRETGAGPDVSPVVAGTPEEGVDPPGSYAEDAGTPF